jgi:hypothetical protein
MIDSDATKEEEVLKRMLNTPPTPHKEKKEGEPKPAPPQRLKQGRLATGKTAPAFARFHFRDAALVDAQVRRNVMLEMPRFEALPYDADSLFVQARAVALAPVLVV